MADYLQRPDPCSRKTLWDHLCGVLVEGSVARHPPGHAFPGGRVHALGGCLSVLQVLGEHHDLCTPILSPQI